MTTEAKTGLTQWSSGATQPDLLFNAFLRHYAASGFRASAEDKDLTAPPTLTTGDAGKSYIVAGAGGTATGVWTGHENHVAYWDGISWWYFVPRENDRQGVLDENTDYRFNGTAWVDAGTAIGTVSLANGGTGAALSDPAADRIMFWDDSAGAVTWLTPGTGLTITGTTIDASVGGVSDGDKGDITVSGSGSVWTIDSDVVSTIRSVPQNSQSAAYTAVLADAGKHILHPSADTTARIFTIPANASVAYPIGTALTFVNQNSAGVITIAITSDTMRLAGAGTTGSRTLAANGIATALKITSTEWIISGTGLT